MGNVYSDPKEFGLKIVHELDDEDKDGYEWGMLVVWLHETSGKLYYDSEGGCSCYSPWEDVETVDKMKPLMKSTFNEFTKAVSDFNANPIAKTAMLRKVDRLLYGD